MRKANDNASISRHIRRDAGDPGGRHGAVGIGGEDPFAPCVVNANGHGAFFCCHFWKFVIDRQKAEIVHARGGDDLGCVISRVVVNDEDFKSVGRIGLLFQGIEALTDIIRFIACGNDDGYKWRFISAWLIVQAE